MPSNQPVGRYRRVVKGSGRRSRDPRFDDLSGEFNPTVFSQTYRFLNDAREQELASLKKSLKKVRSATSKANVENAIDFLQKSKAAAERDERLRQQKATVFATERQLVKQGKKPYFPKKRVLRQIELADKFEQLKKAGGVDKFIAKRRRKNASKDHRWLAHE